MSGKKRPGLEKRKRPRERREIPGRIVDRWGRGMGGLPLVVWAEGEAYSRVTDRRGRFLWPVVEGGKGAGWWSLEVHLPAGPSVTFLLRRSSLPETIRLDPSLEEVKGSLFLDEGGRFLPLQGAGISLVEIPEGRVLAKARTGEGGEWKVRIPREVPAGAVLVQARSSLKGWLGSWYLGDLEKEEPRLVSRRSPVRLLFSPRPPPRDSRILAAPRFSREQVLLDRKMEGGASLRLFLPPGPLQVIVLGPMGRLLGEGRFLSGKEKTVTVEVAEGVEAVLEGKVLGPEGSPLEGARAAFFPASFLGKEKPLPPEDDWNPFLAARVWEEAVTGRDGTFRLVLGPFSRGTLRISHPCSQTGMEVRVELPGASPLAIRLQREVPVEILDLEFQEEEPPAVLAGGLRWTLARKEGGSVKRGRVRCLPAVLSRVDPGDWTLLLEGSGRKASLYFRAVPGRPLRLKPVLR